ncbi:EAL domain-containing protein [bacterium]|nr:EAL domain-containing protein [bacterium]
MGYPEHLHAALEQLQEHLLQSWELSLHELRQENESLRQEIAQQYEENLQLQALRAELTALESERTAQLESRKHEAEKLRELEQQTGKMSQLESELQELRAAHQEAQEKEAEILRQLDVVKQQLEAEAAQSSRLTLEIVDLKLAHEKEILRLRGLADGPLKLNLPDLVDEDKQADPHQELQRLAYQDLNTGLPNLNLARRYLSVELSKTEKVTVALAILRLEGWSEIQVLLPDQEMQQQLLGQFSQRVRVCLRAEDVLASGAEGEFWAIFPLASGGPLGLKSATELAQRSLTKVLESLKSPFNLNDHKLLLNLWGGLAVGQGQVEVEALVRQARLAHQSAVSKGSNRLALFQPELERPAKRRETIEPLLRQALNREQFSLRFLPVVELSSGQIKGVEALVRWEHPTEGILEPAQFLDTACASGVIVALGEWVMSCVCEMSRDFRSLYWFINLSHPELMQADLARRLTRSMEAAQLNRPDYIVVECQEKDLAKPDARVAANLKEFRHWKIGLAVDDFAFAELPLKGLDKRGIGFLKISPKITQDLDQPAVRNLVKGGLIAAEAAGARVVLKGIENQGQLDLALELGCPWGQGHRLSGPLSWPELEERLKSRQTCL